jgi:hypothetical protein
MEQAQRAARFENISLEQWDSQDLSAQGSFVRCRLADIGSNTSAAATSLDGATARADDATAG